MTPLNNAPQIFAIITKAKNYEGGALVVVGAASSKPFVDFVNVLIEGLSTNSWLMPFVVGALSFLIYLTAYILDFITGIQAAKKLSGGKPGYIKSAKLWSSIYKLVAILVIMFALSFFSLVFILVDVAFVSEFFIYAIAAVGLMAFFFDMHSVGENQKKIYGKKPKIFDWLDGISETINETIIQRIKNFKK